MNQPQPEADLRDEYDFDYSQAKSNRFAGRFRSATMVEPSQEGILQRLQDATAEFEKNQDVAASKVDQFNATLRQSASSDELAALQVIGKVVWSQELPSSTESAPSRWQYYALGILGENGIGAFVYPLESTSDIRERVGYTFLPFRECPSIVQRNLANEIDGLMATVSAIQSKAE